jgi:NAD(P)H dehydrogenase (quinone)
MRRVLFTSILLLFGLPGLAAAQCDVRVLVAYYSQTGHTRIMAESVAAGARAVAGTQVTLASVEAVDTAQLRSAHAVIVGSPVQLANVAVPVMEFLNRWPFPDGMRDKVGAAFVSGGGISSGEEETQLAILRAMLIHSMIVVGGGVRRFGGDGRGAVGDAPARAGRRAVPGKGGAAGAPRRHGHPPAALPVSGGREGA